MSSFRYKAFISYSHRDERWAAWLHRALESYRVPRKLVQPAEGTGSMPRRIRPVFRDRDELSSGSDLSQTVQQALAASENLVVVCSPAAAGSRWVKEEIREFVRLGRRDRIFCIIVDGESAEDGSIAELFPPAIAEAGLQEPLAADVRKWADGKHLAKLKLIAGILGVPLDRLRRRDLQKRRRTQMLAALGAIAVLAITALAITARMVAEQRRDSGQTLVEMKLNELRSFLAVKEDPEALGRLREWSAADIEALHESADTGSPSLLDSGLSLREAGIAAWESGDVVGALEHLRLSWALVAEHYRRDRGDQAAFFELGQAEYWIGQMHFDQGELDLAEAAFMSYAEITRRLILLQPNNAEWVLEMAYALTNLGAIQKARGGIDPERTLHFMQSALEYNQIALVLDPNNDVYLSELGQSHANLADAQLGVCDLDGALHTREEGVLQETRVLENDPGDTHRQWDLALAMTGYGKIQRLLGENQVAREYYEKAVLMIEAATRRDPHSRAARMDLAERREIIAWLDAMEGRIQQAWAASNALENDWATLVTDAGLNDVRSLELFSTYLFNRAWLASETGNLGLAIRLLEEGVATLAFEAGKHPDNRMLGNSLTLAAFRYWQVRRELPPPEILSLLPDYNTYNERLRACSDASRAVRKAVMLGHPAEADHLVDYLLGQGYRETGFMRICTEFYSCSGQ